MRELFTASLARCRWLSGPARCTQFQRCSSSTIAHQAELTAAVLRDSDQSRCEPWIRATSDLLQALYVIAGRLGAASDCQLLATELQHLSSPCRLDGELLAGCAQRLRNRRAFVMKDEGASMKAKLHAPLRTYTAPSPAAAIGSSRRQGIVEGTQQTSMVAHSQPQVPASTEVTQRQPLSTGLSTERTAAGPAERAIAAVAPCPPSVRRGRPPGQ